MNAISELSKIGLNTTFGNFVVVEEGVTIGENCVIGNNVVIHKDTSIGNNVRIDDNTVIGKFPMRSVNSVFKDDKEILGANILDGCIIGTSVVIYRGCEIKNDVLVADLSSIRENVSIGNKTIIGRGVSVENYCTIGSSCKIETNAYITAYSKIEDYVFIAPGVVTSNDNYAARSKERYSHYKGVTIKTGGRVGAQATILPGKTIFEDGFVAAGSILTKDVNQGEIVAGNPAKLIRMVPSDQLLKNQ